MVKIIKLLVALILLPTAFFLLCETVVLLFSVLGNLHSAISFILGGVIYSFIHFSFYDFSRIYVFGHEMTHAFAALLCGCRIKDISVGKDSGFVKMDKCNAFVVLAPYFVPLYVLAASLVYMITDLFYPMASFRDVFLFVIGFFTAFHFIQTFKTLFEADQPDLKLAGGKVFSVIMILLANLLVLCLVLKGIFPEQISLVKAGKNILYGTLNLWRIIVNYIVERVINMI